MVEKKQNSEKDDRNNGEIPSLHVVAKSLPQAYYRTVKGVWEKGARIRTEYDRKDLAGKYIDPPSRDARVLVEIKDPFIQPRFPPLSFCEIGKYILEILGVKDHLVVPLSQLKKEIESGGVITTKWPYTYHQRLFSWPDSDGATVDQIKLMLERVAKIPYTRRAVAQTGVPSVDPFMKEDLPCLREMQLRCLEDSNGILKANLTTSWRSRDLYKAWADNVIAITFLQRSFANKLTELMGRKVIPGSYADFSYSLHIYGQDFAQVGGDKEKGIKSFFENFLNEDSFIERSMTSEQARDVLVVPHLEALLNDEYWKFPSETKEMIRNEIKKMKGGYLP